jgi:TRAP-type mannitol/chloroaromatic compound transport system permease small subunit
METLIYLVVLVAWEYLEVAWEVHPSSVAGAELPRHPAVVVVLRVVTDMVVPLG